MGVSRENPGLQGALLGEMVNEMQSPRQIYWDVDLQAASAGVWIMMGSLQEEPMNLESLEDGWTTVVVKLEGVGRMPTILLATGFDQGMLLLMGLAYSC